ncbi:MAG: hypothetical protein NPIRA04_31400 [Nitrospirales bacterium]|nr:MAG: hypothetical protein NPIRA04_31400 [Nitrospirales bacterium]
MGWKTTETPLNLIHILPSDGEKSKPKLPYDNSQSLRIQVGDEAPSVSVKFFAKSIAAVRRGGKQVGEWLHTSVSLCQRGCQRMFSGLTSCVLGLFGLVKNGLGASVTLVVRSAKRARESSEKISDKIWKMYTKKRNVSIPEPRIVPATIESPTNIAPTPKLERDELLWEVHALRDQLTAQRREFTRVNTQIGELKALALSQQQVLLHLGKELESIESKTVRTEKTAPKKVKARSAKTAKSKPFPSSSQSPRETSIRFDPPR